MEKKLTERTRNCFQNETKFTLGVVIDSHDYFSLVKQKNFLSKKDETFMFHVQSRIGKKRAQKSSFEVVLLYL